MASKNQPEPNIAPVKFLTASRNCAICGGNECEVLHEQRFVLPEGHPLANGYAVVTCRRCGFVYADTQVSQADYDMFYTRFSKYESITTSTGGGGSPEDAQRLKEMAAYIARTIPDRQARIVDIGCANGGLLKELRDLGYSRLCGIDPSPACVAATKTLCGAEGYVGALSSLPPNAGQFDGVVLSHVLEHVQDLQQAVESIGNLTRPGGIVYVEVPDASRYAECLLAPFQDFNTEHINHFSLESLRNLFGRRGWNWQAGGGKTMFCGPGMPYPAVFSCFKKNLSPTGFILKNDTNLRIQIENYIVASRCMMEAIDRQIAGVLAQHQVVIVWGTGQLAMKLLGETCLGRGEIAAFVDGNPINQGKLLKGRPILAPKDLLSSQQPIIVTSIIQGQAIAQAIKQLNLANPVVLLTS